MDNVFTDGLVLNNFWQALSLDALAEARGVRPMDDITALFGTWPGDPDDGFEEMIDGLRKRDVNEGTLMAS